MTVEPQDCPDPSYHETFNYCPNCSWTRDSCGHVGPFFGTKCTQAEGHDGKHTATLKWE